MPRKKSSPSAPLASPPESIANLETRGEQLKIFSLRTLLTNKKRKETRDAARLGDVLIPWFEQTVAKPAQKLEKIAEVWQEHVPANIVKRSRLLAFQKGTLTVALDSTTVRAELDTKLRGGLLRLLQTGSRGDLFRVKTCVQGTIPDSYTEAKAQR